VGGPLTCSADPAHRTGDLTGRPVLSLPVGLHGAGLPMGMQVTGRPFDEATVLRVGMAYEQASGRAAPGRTLAGRPVSGGTRSRTGQTVSGMRRWAMARSSSVTSVIRPPIERAYSACSWSARWPAARIASRST
jgi:hypothetical protein